MVAAHLRSDLLSAGSHGMKTVYVRRPTEDVDVRDGVKSKAGGGRCCGLVRGVGCFDAGDALGEDEPVVRWPPLIWTAKWLIVIHLVLYYVPPEQKSLRGTDDGPAADGKPPSSWSSFLGQREEINYQPCSPQ